MTTPHAERVLQSIESPRASARSSVAASWRRCFVKHRLDPNDKTLRAEADSSRLAERRDALGRLLHVAEPRLEDLYRMIGHCGRGIFLTDDEGLILSERIGASDRTAFGEWGLMTGSDWSEAAQGTNGIGTCIEEGRPLIIHRDQHYLPSNTAMSCIDAPVFGPDGRLIAALDVSSARMDQTEGFNQLIGAMVTKVAAQIETDLFREVHSGHRILLAGEDDAAVLLAVDRDDIVVGATRAARRRFELEREDRVRPRALRELTGEDARGLEGAERAAVIRALTRTEGNVSAAARDLGIGRATLYRRMKRLGISENMRDLSQG